MRQQQLQQRRLQQRRLQQRQRQQRVVVVALSTLVEKRTEKSAVSR